MKGYKDDAAHGPYDEPTYNVAQIFTLHTSKIFCRFLCIFITKDF
jgi:hypothetical protein